MAGVIKQPWADKPFALLQTPRKTLEIKKETTEHAVTMTLIHNMIVRSLNAIYLQAEGVSLPVDIADFLVFCQAWYGMVHAHHNGEETHLFPLLEKYTGEAGIMAGNLEQHRIFDEGLQNFKHYIFNTSPSDYDGKALKITIDEFGPTLTTHLHEEVGTILNLDRHDAKKVTQAFTEWSDHSGANIEDKEKSLPIALSSNDRSFEDNAHKNWPPFPFFVPYLVEYYYGRKHRGSWRFGPCSISGVPRPLEFVKPSY